MHRALPAWLLLAGPATAAPDVWVVDDDGGPGVDFTDLQAAVDAAASLDTVLVKAGTYGDVVIDGKSLHLVAELGETVVLDDAQLVVRNVGSAQAVVVRGIDVLAPVPPFGQPLPPEDVTALLLHDSPGRIWIEDCELALPTPVFGFAAVEGPAGVVASCAAVTLVGCRFTASPQALVAQPEAADRSALVVRDGSVFLHGCELFGAGGPGGVPASTPACVPGALGGAGLALEGGFLHASDTLLRGGDGLTGGMAAGLLTPGEGGDGGHALWLLPGAPSAAQLLDCMLVAGGPGPGGEHIDGTVLCPDGDPGLPLVASGSPVTSFPANAPGLTADSPVHVGQVSNVAFAGEPFDFVILAASALQTALPLPPYQGALHLGGTPIQLPIGFLDGAGTGALPIFAPPNPPGFEGVTYYLQTVHVTLALEIVLGPPTTLTAWTQGSEPSSR